MKKEQISAIYKMAKAIYNKEERLVNGKDELSRHYGINKNSFADYYRALQKMLDGELHKRSINSDLRDYYLSQIYNDYGAGKLKVALDAYMESIVYYEESHNNMMRKIDREIYQKHYNVLNTANSKRETEK